MNSRSSRAALLIVSALFFLLRASATAAPALWVVQSTVGKVYLFGTVHALRANTAWRSPELDAALQESTSLYLELADAGKQSDIVSATMKLGIDRDHPLSSKISKSDVSLLDAMAKRYGLMGEAAFEPMKPWLALTVLSTAPMLHSGYAQGNGGDLSLDREFRTAGKPVLGLETIDFQMHTLADIPESDQIAMLDAYLQHANAESSVAYIDNLVSAWVTGDQDKLADVGKFADMASGKFGAALLANRNRTWAATLAERLKQPGTAFVAVGAAHMLGPDGVPALLEKMGFTVSRVTIAQTYIAQVTSAPSPSSSDAPASPAPVPTPTPRPTAIPQTLTPPTGWKPAQIPATPAGMIVADKLWVDSQHGGYIMAGHADLGTSAGIDLDTFGKGFHEGLVMSAGEDGVAPSKHVRTCGGTQDAIYSKVWLHKRLVKEDFIVAVSDRAYLGQYVRAENAKDDPAAVRALLSLCAPGAPAAKQ